MRISSARQRIPFIMALGAAWGCVSGESRELTASTIDHFLPPPDLDPDKPYSNPERALGPPDGRTVALSRGASLTLRFFRPIPDGPGPDLRVVEIGPGDGSRAKVAVSEDGAFFREFEPVARAGAATGFDLEEVGLEAASLVRIRGLDDENGADPGFDLDAIEALN